MESWPRRNAIRVSTKFALTLARVLLGLLLAPGLLAGANDCPVEPQRAVFLKWFAKFVHMVVTSGARFELFGGTMIRAGIGWTILRRKSRQGLEVTGASARGKTEE